MFPARSCRKFLWQNSLSDSSSSRGRHLGKITLLLVVPHFPKSVAKKNGYLFQFFFVVQAKKELLHQSNIVSFWRRLVALLLVGEAPHNAPRPSSEALSRFDQTKA